MYLRLELIYQHYLTNMKDQHNHKITEHEFTKDIGHRTEMTKTTEEMFNKLCNLPRDSITGYVVDNTGYNQIKTEITKQIQSDLLKEVLRAVRDYKNYYNPIGDEVNQERHRTAENIMKQIKKLAEEKEILINNYDNRKLEGGI